MEFRFSGEVWHWRGPAPHHFVSLPAAEAEMISEVAAAVTYGWGMIPVRASIGSTEFTTSLWPKDGTYVLGLKAAVRREEAIELGDTVAVTMSLDSPAL